jgi:hypothetical protein
MGHPIFEYSPGHLLSISRLHDERKWCDHAAVMRSRQSALCWIADEIRARSLTRLKDAEFRDDAV